MKIGQLSKQSGCSIQTIRFYEKQGLLPQPERSQGNFRLYNHELVQQLEFIKHCRNLDISLTDIKQMLALRRFPETSCESINNMIDSHLQQVKIRIKELQSLKTTLAEMSRACHAGNDIDHCGVLRSLDSA